MLISEIFYSIQGEGELTGVPSVFVRTSGCNLRCSWCDTPYASWNPEGQQRSVPEIVAAVDSHRSARHVVLTGGEPMIAKDIVPLAKEIKSTGRHVTIETAATVAPAGIACDLASLSPKLLNSAPDPVEHAVWRKKHEATRWQPDVVRAWVDQYPYQFKFVVSRPEDVDELEHMLAAVQRDIPRHKVLLMPEATSLEKMRGRAAWLGNSARRAGTVTRTVCTSNCMATDAEPRAPHPASSGTSVIAPVDWTRPRKLSEELAMILREFEVETVTLREVLGLLHGRGHVLLVMLLALPFCTPVPLPGVSTPFGLIITIIGARLAMGVKPWLPARLLDTHLSPRIFAKVFAFTRKIILAFERLLRPRLLWVTSTPRRLQLHAVPIVICALMLLLPLPIPFSNVVPAWGIMLISGGLLERDGAFILAGYAASIFTVAFFAIIAIFGVEAVDFIWNWIR